MVIAGLTPREAVRAVEVRLSTAGCPDADYDARELFRVAAGRDARLSDRVLTTEEAEKLEALCTRREQREPLQYLCGIWSFLDFDLAVGPGVLCPRADTVAAASATTSVSARGQSTPGPTARSKSRKLQIPHRYCSGSRCSRRVQRFSSFSASSVVSARSERRASRPDAARNSSRAS